jgi:hypothetical protein
VLHAARRAVESLTMDRDVMHERDRLAPRFAELIYNGFWYAPEMEFMRAAIDASQRGVTGEARVRLFKGCAPDHGRQSPVSRYSMRQSSFDEAGGYDQRDAAASSGSRACGSRARGRSSTPLFRLAATLSAHLRTRSRQRTPSAIAIRCAGASDPVACSATAGQHAAARRAAPGSRAGSSAAAPRPRSRARAAGSPPTRPPSASTAEAIAL